MAHQSWPRRFGSTRCSPKSWPRRFGKHLEPGNGPKLASLRLALSGPCGLVGLGFPRAMLIQSKAEAIQGLDEGTPARPKVIPLLTRHRPHSDSDLDGDLRSVRNDASRQCQWRTWLRNFRILATGLHQRLSQAAIHPSFQMANLCVTPWGMTTQTAGFLQPCQERAAITS